MSTAKLLSGDPPYNITITDSAAVRILTLMAGENSFDLALRVHITGGGCSGFQYQFSFEDADTPDDVIFEKPLDAKHMDAELLDAWPKEKGTPHIHVYIDSFCMQYLVGATIDYLNDLDGERFVIQNPNATGTCGCGNSFSV